MLLRRSFFSQASIEAFLHSQAGSSTPSIDRFIDVAYCRNIQ
jgi:hypothetical protein